MRQYEMMVDAACFKLNKFPSSLAFMLGGL